MTDSTPATPTGKPDDRDREKWLLLGLITLESIEAARMAWLDYAHPAYSGILVGTGGWKWDGPTQNYRGPVGHSLDATRLKNLSVTTAHQAERDLRGSATGVATGGTPIEVWQDIAARAVNTLHTTQAALACGGFDRLANSPELIAAAQGSPDKPPGLLFSIARLASFAQDVASGKEATVAAIQNRAAAYSEASNATFETVKRASHTAEKDDKGRAVFLYERNVLANADHCRDEKDTLGCPTCTRAGWVPIGSLPLPGLRSCRQNCLCSMDYSLVGNALGTN